MRESPSKVLLLYSCVAGMKTRGPIWIVSQRAVKKICNYLADFRLQKYLRAGTWKRLSTVQLSFSTILLLLEKNCWRPVFPALKYIISYHCQAIELRSATFNSITKKTVWKLFQKKPRPSPPQCLDYYADPVVELHSSSTVNYMLGRTDFPCMRMPLSAPCHGITGHGHGHGPVTDCLLKHEPK